MKSISAVKGKTYSSGDLLIQEVLNTREAIEQYIAYYEKEEGIGRRKIILQLNAFGVYLSKVR